MTQGPQNGPDECGLSGAQVSLQEKHQGRVQTIRKALGGLDERRLLESGLKENRAAPTPGFGD